MEQQENTGQPQPNPLAVVGSALREAREQQGLSIEEVAIRLKFAPRQIAALEEGRFDQLPEMIFVRGFVRSYARLLQVDENPLLEALPGAPVQGAPLAHKGEKQDILPGSGRAGKQNVPWLAAALGVAVITAFLAWKYNSEGTDTRAVPPTVRAPMTGAASGVQQIVASAASAVNSEFPQTGASPETENSEGPASAAVAATPVKPPHKLPPSQPVKVEFVGSSWVEIKDAGGRVVLSMLGEEGASRSVSGSPPLTVVVGNANAVKLYYKNEPVDLGQHAEHDVVRLKLE